MRTITKDESGLAWGITMFLMLLAVSVIAFTALGPAMEGINNAFDDGYKAEYMTESGISTSETLYNMYGHIIIVVLLIGVAYVIIRATQSNNDTGGMQ